MYYQKKLVSVMRLEKEIALFNKQLQSNSFPKKKNLKFHKVLNKLKKMETPVERLAFLKNEARKKPWQKAKRDYLKLRAVRHNLSTKKCCICGNLASCMHHVKPLINGGNNNFSNLVPVCKKCHEKIHPFMKKKRQKAKDLQKFINKNAKYEVPKIYV